MSIARGRDVMHSRRVIIYISIVLPRKYNKETLILLHETFEI